MQYAPRTSLPPTAPNGVTGGIDWASTDHAACVVDAAGQVLTRLTVAHTTASLPELVRRLAQAGVCEVAIERGDGPVVNALLEAGITGFRWAVNKQPRDAVGDFAADSRRANPWAAKLYADTTARGEDHPDATRILARAWLYVIWHCWHDGVPHDPAKHRALPALLQQDQPTRA